MIAEVNITQIYENLEENNIEAIYEFMISDTAAVCGFEAIIDDERKVIEIVKEADKQRMSIKKLSMYLLHYNVFVINDA
ncbi:von willebrand domain-containing protein [Gigaspora margarita]|uniref:von willebrand domain-containing protein n=1 Tax=Gigaspora margarita TaxID=4874 RepID=A0A8H4EVN3_GIGMA|nr:von willebrand domain-containing protein [Gigaspora margarita]